MIRRLTLLAALLLLLGGCGVGFFYSHLDWLIPSYVSAYLPLDDPQRRRLDAHVAGLLDWHCGAQLGQYAGWLRGVNADLQAGRLNRDRLQAHATRLESYWQELAAQAAPRLADLLAHSSDAQIRDLLENLREKDRDFREDYVDAPADEVQERLAERMERRLKRWVGSLTDGQRQAIAAWSRQTVRDQADSLAMRARWREAVAQALTLRRDPQRFTPLVQELAAHPERSWTEAQRRQFEARRAQVLRLLETLAASLTERQRRHLAEQAGDWAQDFERLACAGGRPGSQARSPALPAGNG